MKRLTMIILMLLFMFLLTGCGEITNSQKTEKDMFVVIQESDSFHYYDVVYQKDTKVMYTVSHGPYSYGNFTLLVNPDGTPMLYEEEGEE